MASRPRILINFAVSLDGKINPAPARRHGRFVMSRGKEDWRRMRVLREQGDAILIGAENLRVDDPALSLEPDERDRRRAAGQSLPARIVVTRRGEGIRTDAKIFDRSTGGAAYIVHAGVMPAATRAVLAGVAQLVELGSETVPTEALLAWLHDTLGARTVVCEGGGVLVAELFAAHAVDEMYLTVVPRILGGITAPTLAAGAGFDPDQIPDAKLVSLERVDDELFLRYELPRP
ncbi:MAG TPA: dihydrofolate reductase family protein [Polyangia bacterium]|jgi:5-amino-6-(5-phosphoribosylamino)uracil reductase|nr:dihydrofolate reductase family protein [Polyangia bacterium]